MLQKHLTEALDQRYEMRLAHSRQPVIPHAALASAEEFLRVMKDFGWRFALDDFGAGQSSYDYLQQLAVDFVKIDGMFVRELETNLSDYAMVKSVTEIGRFMGKKTVADSVDNDVVLSKLKEIGVDYVQGALVESPVPLQDLH